MTSWSNGPYGFPYIDYFANCLISAEGYSIQKSNNKLAKPNIGLFRSSEAISEFQISVIMLLGFPHVGGIFRAWKPYPWLIGTMTEIEIQKALG